MLLLTGGCAYFNTFYHARQFYSQAEKAHETELKKANGLAGQGTGTAGTVNTADPRYATNPNMATGRSSDLYSKCIDKCKKVIEDYPGSKWQDDARLLMAKAYYGKGDFLSARSELDHFAERFPKSNKLAEAAYWRGLTAFAQEEYPEARSIWGDLLTRYPKYDGRENAEFYIAEALREEDLPEQAEDAYRKFLDRYSKGDLSVQARLALGKLLMTDKSYDRANELFTYVATKAPDEEARLEAKLQLGEVLEAQDENEAALKTYQDVELWLDPNVFKGRITAKEREAINKEQQQAQEQARQDSLRNAQFGLPAGTTQPGGVAGTDPSDPRMDPTNPNHYPLNPVTNQPDSRMDPTDPSHYPISPLTNQPDPRMDPSNPNHYPVNPATGQPDPNYTANDPSNPNNYPINPATNQPDPNYNPNDPGNPFNTGVTTNPQTGQPVGSAVAAQMNQEQRQTLPRTDPRYEQLGRVLLKEGQALAAVGKPWDAILAYEQVIAEYRGTPYAAEAQYRIGYTYEVDLEDFDEAEKAYQGVASQGRSSFTEDAQRRAKNLGTVKSLLAEASSDSASAATAAAAQADFMRAELYLFQQDKPEKALAEYQEIQKDFPGTDHEAKAALAEAWVRMNSLADTARGRAKYAEVMRRFPDTEYGRRATRILKGPAREPSPDEFGGPTLAELRDPLNIASVTARDSLQAAADSAATAAADSAAALAAAPPDTSAGPSIGERQRELLERMRGGAPADSGQAGVPPPGGSALDRALASTHAGSTPGEPPVFPPGGHGPPGTEPVPVGQTPSGAQPVPGVHPPPGGQPPPGNQTAPGNQAPPDGKTAPQTPPGGPVPAKGPPLEAATRVEPSPAGAAVKAPPGEASPAEAAVKTPPGGTPPATSTPPTEPPEIQAVEDTVPPAPMPPPEDLGRKPVPLGPSGVPLDPMAVPAADGWSPTSPADSAAAAPADTAGGGAKEIAADSLGAMGQNGAAPADSAVTGNGKALPDSSAAVGKGAARADSVSAGTGAAAPDSTTTAAPNGPVPPDSTGAAKPPPATKDPKGEKGGP